MPRRCAADVGSDDRDGHWVLPLEARWDFVPDRVLDRPYARRLADLIPVALLGAVIAVETFPDGLDSLLATRLIGVAAGMVADPQSPIYRRGIRRCRNCSSASAWS